MGETVCGQLQSRRVPVVIVDREEALDERLPESGLPFVCGDATDDAVLRPQTMT